MNRQQRKEREQQYLAVVKKGLWRDIAIFWIALLIIFYFSTRGGDISSQERVQSLLQLIGAGGPTTLLLYRISLNGGTARATAQDANDIAEKVMLIEKAKLMDGAVHERAFDLALRYPQVEKEHVRLFLAEEDYATLPKCIKLQRLSEKFAPQVDDAMERARQS